MGGKVFGTGEVRYESRRGVPAMAGLLEATLAVGVKVSGGGDPIPVPGGCFELFMS